MRVAPWTKPVVTFDVCPQDHAEVFLRIVSNINTVYAGRILTSYSWQKCYDEHGQERDRVAVHFCDAPEGIVQYEQGDFRFLEELLP